MPFERLIEICRAHDVLSCIDGAHGIGQFPLDLTILDPDFFMSNLHKWLHVPRACGFLYVPGRNQHLIRATLPTGFSFIPLARASEARKGFVTNFASVGTLDDNPYICIQAALDWRSKLTWSNKKGEDAIMSYTQTLALDGGKRVAELLGTEVMDNETHTLTKCSMTNVRLPLSISAEAGKETTNGDQIAAWVMKTMICEYQTAVNVFFYSIAWWVRLSAQVYNSLEDFERAARFLQDACERVEKGEWKL